MSDLEKLTRSSSLENSSRLAFQNESEEARLSYLKLGADKVGAIFDDDLEFRSGFRNEYSTLIKNAFLFMRGGIGVTGSVVLGALDEAKPDSSTGQLCGDLFLGSVKGLSSRLLFHGVHKLSVAPRSICLGVGTRFIDKAFSRDSYLDSSGNVDFLSGLERAAAGSAYRTDVASDIAFGVAGNLFFGQATRGLQNKLFRQSMINAGCFGLITGSAGELMRQRENHEEFDWYKVLVRAGTRAIGDQISSVPAVIQSQRRLSSNLERMVKAPLAPAGQTIAAVGADAQTKPLQAAGADDRRVLVVDEPPRLDKNNEKPAKSGSHDETRMKGDVSGTPVRHRLDELASRIALKAGGKVESDGSSLTIQSNTPKGTEVVRLSLNSESAGRVYEDLDKGRYRINGVDGSRLGGVPYDAAVVDGRLGPLAEATVRDFQRKDYQLLGTATRVLQPGEQARETNLPVEVATVEQQICLRAKGDPLALALITSYQPVNELPGAHTPNKLHLVAERLSLRFGLAGRVGPLESLQQQLEGGLASAGFAKAPIEQFLDEGARRALLDIGKKNDVRSTLPRGATYDTNVAVGRLQKAHNPHRIMWATVWDASFNASILPLTEFDIRTAHERLRNGGY